MGNCIARSKPLPKADLTSPHRHPTLEKSNSAPLNASYLSSPDTRENSPVKETPDIATFVLTRKSSAESQTEISGFNPKRRLDFTLEDKKECPVLIGGGSRGNNSKFFSEEETFSSLFEALDSDKDGFISPDDLQKGIGALGLNIAQLQLFSIDLNSLFKVYSPRNPSTWSITQFSIFCRDFLKA